MNFQYRKSNIECRAIIEELWSSVFAVRYSIFCLLSSVLCLLFFTGCQQNNKSSPLRSKVEQLTQETEQLQEELAQSNNKNEQLRKQLQVLSGLPKGVRLDNLYHLQSVKIHRYTNLLDEDNDGKMDTLVVYLQPIDQEGDVIKATGAVNVQLWDLNLPNGEALLGQWNVSASELKKHWVAFLVTDYRLTFALPEKIEHFDKPLTVKVTFTDYLSGKVFNEQRVIEPEKP